jgi:ribonuclease BN (tRNA processing enzyme)
LKLRILGSAPGKPEIDKNQACIWIATKAGNILIDCGEGSSWQLMRFGLDKDEIDAIIISHMHPDHISGIYMVLLMFYLKGRSKKLDIFLPESIEQFKDSLNMFYLFNEKSPFNYEIKDINELDLDWVKPLSNDHLSKYNDIIVSQNLPNKMMAYSFVISESGKNLIYTSDVQNLQFLKDYFLDVELVILDSVHPDLEEINRYVKDQEFRFIINHGISDAMLNVLKSIPEERYKFANEKTEIII